MEELTESQKKYISWCIQQIRNGHKASTPSLISRIKARLRRFILFASGIRYIEVRYNEGISINAEKEIIDILKSANLLKQTKVGNLDSSA